MTATILRLGTTRKPTQLDRHLIGHHTQGALPGGMKSRIQSEIAVRSYVRNLSRHFPLSDTVGKDDVWQQVEDIIALVPSLASNIFELDAFAHALKQVICVRDTGCLAFTSSNFQACKISISATGSILRLRLIDHDKARIITVKLHPEGVDRLDDSMARM